ncbi:MAG TPA: ATP-grasp domain-containing protein [Rhizomicrobium sp.]|jgi:predicted ATP-grasp superfamily ATP-dependent carboligase
MNAPFPHDRLASLAGSRPPRNILLLAQSFQAPYRVMRCAAAAGAKVFLFCNDEARSLALSRFCAGYRDFTFEPEPSPDAAATEIETFCRAHKIDMILPADAIATRLLARTRDLLTTPVFPIPDLATFDQLVTKDRFMEFCRANNIRHPEGHILANREALVAAIKNGCIKLPAILKPINRWGSVGVVKIDSDSALEIAAKIDYAPILVQDFVEGVDRSISIFARKGAVLKQVTYCYPDGAFTFQREPELARIVGDIAANLKLDGVFNFDARIDADGTVWLIECNPRFFFTMDAAMVAGANFAKIEMANGAQSRFSRIEAGPDGPVITVADGQLRQPEALLKNLLRGRFPNAMDGKMLVHWLRDPVYFGLAVAGYKRRWNSGTLERLLVAHKRAA